jgi:hypothetical protein
MGSHLCRFRSRLSNHYLAQRGHRGRRRAFRPPTIQPQQLNFFKNSKPGAPPGRIVFNLWATCERVIQIASQETAKALATFTLWTPEALVKRFNLYPAKPLLLLLLRAYHLNTPLIVAEDPSYEGCRSWVPLVDLTLPP